MAYTELDVCSLDQSFEGAFNIRLEESSAIDLLVVSEVSTSSACNSCSIPKPPPLPGKDHIGAKLPHRLSGYSYVPKETKDIWIKLFEEGYRADVHIVTDNKAIIPAHSSVLGIASPVLRHTVDQAKVKDGVRCIKIPGVPFEAVHAFVRFIYSSCYKQDEMENFVLHLLVLSHTFCVPSLKKVCIKSLEQALLTVENVIDVLQLARESDAPRLSLFCVRLIINNFKTVSKSEGWKVMKRADPSLEQELLGLVVEADSHKQERLKKMGERKIYLQLYEAMEALLHICRDGCRTIGPRDKVLKGSQTACGFPACKGIESLVRHFSTCKTRVPGGCMHCKRMWQLLELHSRMCSVPDVCKVPLCRHFKEKIQSQSKKEETKWKLLVRKVTAVTRMPNSAIWKGSSEV
ncbi:BTB/POZ and TAZ domain-containing protein 3-like [Aristolochia californica]|uniref:BTB/POZ and TAZ domain-containing protein 3-like n=1 Tax=Aristolochia californica TaxID=171875 RepID=UPI0035DFA584